MRHLRQHRKFRPGFYLAFILILLASACRAANDTDQQPATVASDLGVVWGMAFLSPSQMIFTQRDGRIGLLTLDAHGNQKNLQPLSGAPEVWAKGQGGLLDVAVPPGGYRAGDWIYFTYSKPAADTAVTALARARLEGDALIDWSDLLVTRSRTDTSRHFGSRIAFDDAGHLFFGVGDRGHRPNGQDLSTHAGTIMRLNLDGSVPADNPFVGVEGALPEIWSYGHRNPQGLCFDQQRGALWEGEHGPRGGDEVNRILPGRNYGWAEVSHGKEYTSMAAVGEATEREDVEPAQKVYIPSIAAGSLLCYRGDLLQGALKLTHLNHLQLSAEGEVTAEHRYFESAGERMRSLAEADDGSIYIGTDSGRILRLKNLPAR